MPCWRMSIQRHGCRLHGRPGLNIWPGAAIYWRRCHSNAAAANGPLLQVFQSLNQTKLLNSRLGRHKFVKILSSVNPNLSIRLLSSTPNMTITLSRALCLFVCGGLSAKFFTGRYFIMWRAALTRYLLSRLIYQVYQRIVDYDGHCR